MTQRKHHGGRPISAKRRRRSEALRSERYWRTAPSMASLFADFVLATKPRYFAEMPMLPTSEDVT